MYWSQGSGDERCESEDVESKFSALWEIAMLCN